VVFSSFHLLPPLVAVGFGILATILSSIHSIRVLANRVSPDRVPRPLWQLLIRFGFVRSSCESL
jgi:hypothetical protein